MNSPDQGTAEMSSSAESRKLFGAAFRYQKKATTPVMAIATGEFV